MSCNKVTSQQISDALSMTCGAFNQRDVSQRCGPEKSRRHSVPLAGARTMVALRISRPVAGDDGTDPRIQELRAKQSFRKGEVQ